MHKVAVAVVTGLTGVALGFLINPIGRACRKAKEERHDFVVDFEDGHRTYYDVGGPLDEREKQRWDSYIYLLGKDENRVFKGKDRALLLNLRYVVRITYQF